MKVLSLFLVVIVTGLLVFSCAEKMGEREYFNLASQYMEQQNWEKAELNFDIIHTKFPNGLFSSKALFMIGYLNANHLNNYEKARTYYTEFLEKYPDHELAVAAKYELDNMGKSVDELPFLITDEQQESDNEKAIPEQKVSTSN